MDPINSQPINNQEQTVPQPQNAVDTTGQQAVQYRNPNTNKVNKAVLLLIVLLILVIGLAAYLFFVNTSNNSQNTAPEPNPLPSPVAAVTPTPQLTDDDLTIEDPEVDIKALDQAAASL